MATFVAFLRAVNVKPRWVKMELLRTVLSDNGLTDVETHLQTGNVLVTTPGRSAVTLQTQLRELLSANFGFDIPVVIRTPRQLRTLAREVDSMPSPLSAGAKVYLALADGTVDAAGAETLEGWDRPGERAAVRGSNVILWLDVPAHSAKLTNARIERVAKRTVTTRDMSVVRALAKKWGA